MNLSARTTAMCSKTMQRYAALLFNFVFFVCGVSVMVAAAFVVSDEVGKLSGRGISTGLIVIGVLIVIVSALGGQASWSHDLSKCSFFYMVVLLFVVVATSVLCGLVFKDAAMKENLSSGWNVADAETKRDIQESLRCCGFNKVSDRVVLPFSFVDPCEPSLHTVVDERMGSMKSCAFVLLGLEIVGLVCTCLVACLGPRTPDRTQAGSYGGGSITRSDNRAVLGGYAAGAPFAKAQNYGV